MANGMLSWKHSLIKSTRIMRIWKMLHMSANFMMTSSNGNILRVTGPLCEEFTGDRWIPPAQRPVTRSFDIFFDLRLNKRLSKQSCGWWFETPSGSSWRHCNVRLLLTDLVLTQILFTGYWLFALQFLLLCFVEYLRVSIMILDVCQFGYEFIAVWIC